MCGIVGYLGGRPAVPILLDGLTRLEYRGYDSSGIAILDDRALSVHRCVGGVGTLRGKISALQLGGTVGIGHTRWATHGKVSECNAHPHVSGDGRFALVHNGVIENQLPIRRFLERQGCRFQSETDTEVLCNLIAHCYRRSSATPEHRFVHAVHTALQQVEGTYGIAVIGRDHPGEMVAARLASPLLVGTKEGESLVASDAAATGGRIDRVVYLSDGQLAHLSTAGMALYSAKRERIEVVSEAISWTAADSEKGSYPHFMEKEIFEQPSTLDRRLRSGLADDRIVLRFDAGGVDEEELANARRFVFCGCGSAWHAGVVARHLIERFARVPVEVEYASELRYRDAPFVPGTIYVMISQSGETLDTLAALRQVKATGQRAIAITNVVGSSIAREADATIYQQSGPEISVASTKAFTSQLLVLAMLAGQIARGRNGRTSDADFVAGLRQAPACVARVLEQAPRIHEIAKRYAQATGFLFLARLSLYPIALEGALKLKELSYVHAEAYPAAEMKHGPIALVSRTCPTVFFAGTGQMLQKTVSGMEEIRARHGPIVAIATEKSSPPTELCDELIILPSCHEAILPIVATIPVQLLSYFFALERGCNVDKPRNLAKSVTVE